jgi:hypothetical protein
VDGGDACARRSHHECRLAAEHAGARTAAPVGCGITTAAVQLQDGDTLAFGGERIKALHTPGHTAGSMSYVWRDHVFTGDTLLINGCGRTDFQSGSAEALYRSITKVLFALPDDTTVWPAHDYQGRTNTTIGTEKANNPRLAGKTEADFVAIMASLDLPRPKRMDEAVPANLSSGMRHDAGGGPLLDARPAAGYAATCLRNSPTSGGSPATRCSSTFGPMPSASGWGSFRMPFRSRGSNGREWR